MKKIYKFLIGLLVVIVIIIGYVQYKFISSENEVTNYLTVNEGFSEDSIDTEPFIANLEGDKNWMVSVKIKGDSTTYYYYLNDKNKVVLESYTKNREEKVVNQVMN